MDRSDFQQLRKVRQREARCLLSAKQYPGAYYLSGLAVECALKACIAKKTRRYDFPDKSRVNASWSHDLEGLVTAADLKDELRTKSDSSHEFSANWATVKDWKVEKRYAPHIGRALATDIYQAISRRNSGVLSWLRNHW